MQSPTSPDAYPIITTAQTAEYNADVWTLKDVVTHYHNKEGITVLESTAPDGKLNLRVNFSQVMTPPLREDQLAFPN